MPVKQNPAYLPPTLLVQCGRLSVHIENHKLCLWKKRAVALKR